MGGVGDPLSYVALGFALIPLLEALVNYLQLKHALEDPDTTLTLMGYDADIERVVARHFGFFFYGSTVLFALTHITNYEPLSTQTLLLAPALVFPQFIVGTMLGYIRVRYGIGYSILFHVVINAIFFVLAHFFPS